MTTVIDIASIPSGQTAADIRNYIQDAYDNWDPAPTYVLLVGDSDFVTTNYQRANGSDIEHGYGPYNGANVGTDLYYGTVDGADHYPDIFVGRISVETLAQATNVFNKILAYEQNPPANANYYSDTSLVQLFEDVRPTTPGPPQIVGDGREEATFRIIEFAEEIFPFLQNGGYTPNRIYDRSGNFANGPQQYENGTALPAALTIAGGFPWTGGTADISNAINAGNFLVIYDGHGNRQGWGRPSFTNTNEAALANVVPGTNPPAVLPPVIFSFACETGWFDNETDDDTALAVNNRNTANNAESLCEAFLRHQNGGAAGVLGACRVSYEENDFMMLGAVTAVWPAFNPDPPFSGGTMPDYSIAVLNRLGQVNTFSKIFMANAYEDDELQFELYHTFGDPEMPVWTAQPTRLIVASPQGIGSTGQQDFVVTVQDANTNSPVNMAQVSLTKDGTLLATRQTNPAGIARFTLTGLSAGTAELTVIATNHIPSTTNVTISAGGGQINRLDPADGPESQVLSVGGLDFSGGEAIDISLGSVMALSTASSSSGTFGQAGEAAVSLSIPSPYLPGPVNIVAYGRGSMKYGVDVFSVRTANPIDLYTYSQWDSSTWGLHSGDNPTWDNPEIQLFDAATNQAVESNNLVVGHTYRIEASVHNDTGFAANNAQVTFKWANFGIGQPDQVWQNIGTVSVTVPGNSISRAGTSWSPGSTGHICLMAEIYHLEDINTANNSGQENCHVGPTSSPAEIQFEVWNPTRKPVKIYFELRQLLLKENIKEGDVLWGARLAHPEPQLIPPGQRTKATVIIDPATAVTKIRPGKTAEFALTGFVNGKIIGGVNFRITKR